MTSAAWPGRFTPIIPRLTIAVIVLLALAGCILVIYSNAVAPWGYSDTAEYIGSARSLLGGDGLGTYNASGEFAPLSLHPPLYPLALSFLGLFTSDLITAAGWLNVFLFGAVILAVGVITYRLSRSSWLAIILAASTLLAPGMLSAYTGIMSEPLHHTLMLAALLPLAVYLETDKPWPFALAAGFAGLAFGARYVGLSVPAAGALAILLFGQKRFGRRLLEAAVFGLIGILPVGLWKVTGLIQYGSAGGFPLDINMNLWQRLQPMRLFLVETIFGWLPLAGLAQPAAGYNQMRNILAACGLGVVTLLVVLFWKVRRSSHHRAGVSTAVRFWGVFAVFTATYLLIYIFAYVFGKPQPDLIERLLFPVYLGGLFTFFLSLWVASRAWGSNRIIPVLALIIAVGYGISFLQADLAYARGMHADGDGYTSLAWMSSPTLALVRELPPDVPLVSNEFSVVHLLLERRTYGVTELVSNTPLPVFTRFGDSPTDDAERAFREDGAALIVFTSLRWQFDRLYPGQSDARLDAFTRGLYLYRQTSDGAIYFYERPAWLDGDQP